jgi:hypothetical protein
MLPILGDFVTIRQIEIVKLMSIFFKDFGQFIIGQYLMDH